MDNKLIFENWRKFLAEEAGSDPTVADFMKTFVNANPKSAKKILGKAARWMTAAAIGGAVSAVAGAATGGIGLAAGGAAAHAANMGLNQLFGTVANKSTDLAKFLVTMGENQVDDNQRTGLALYYDLDDEYEQLLQGMDSDLANKYQEHLFAYFKQAFENMRNIENPETEPLSRYIDKTANDFLEDFLSNAGDSEVGVNVKVNR